MIKLIASDLDGTLLQDGTQELTPHAISLIHSLTQKGLPKPVMTGASTKRQQRNTPKRRQPNISGGIVTYLPIIKTLQIKICTKILKTLTDGDTTKNSYVILKLTNNETNHYNLFYMSVIRHNISPCRKRQLHTENTGKTTGIHNRFQIPSPGVRMLCRHVQIQSHRLSWLFNTRYPLFQKIHPPHKRLYSQGDTCPER